MKLHCDSQHPDWQPCAAKVKIFLDGSERKNVVWADEEGRRAIVLKLDADGKPIYNGDMPVYENFIGSVVIVVPEDAEAEATASYVHQDTGKPMPGDMLGVVAQAKELEQVMTQVPKWGEGAPGSWEEKRYAKPASVIPAYVYFDRTTLNFYRADNKECLGEPYYQLWRHRATDFPATAEEAIANLRGRYMVSIDPSFKADTFSIGRGSTIFAAPAKPAVTRDDVVLAARTAIDVRGKERVVEVFRKYGGGKLSDITEEHYAACLADLQALLLHSSLELYKGELTTPKKAVDQPVKVKIPRTKQSEARLKGDLVKLNDLERVLRLHFAGVNSAFEQLAEALRRAIDEWKKLGLEDDTKKKPVPPAPVALAGKSPSVVVSDEATKFQARKRAEDDED